VTPVLAGYFIREFGWRGTFVIFGAVGLVWAAAFAAWFRENPAHHPAVNAAERDLIGPPRSSAGHAPIPWRAISTNRNIWLLGSLTSCTSASSYVYFSWYATYLKEARDVGSIERDWLTSLVLAGGAIGMLSGGVLTDQILRRRAARDRARCHFGAAGFTAAGMLLLSSTAFSAPVVAALLTAASYFVMSCIQPLWWSCVFDISGRHVGALSGLLNSMGVPGAMASQYFFGKFADWMKAQGFSGRAQFDPAFFVYSGLLLGGALLWLFVDPSRAVDTHDAPTEMPGQTDL
jgi:sugar phosphate permease